MERQERFGECLQRMLNENGMSASEAARLVGFRSRNSMFRILAGETSWEVDARFLAAMRERIGDKWPEACWRELDTALRIKRLGMEQYLSNLAFLRVIHDMQEQRDYMVNAQQPDGRMLPLRQVLTELCADAEALEVILCGCCDRDLMTLLAQCLGEAGDQGRLSVRHYIDVRNEALVGNILGVLPLMTKVWYNARLVDEDRCPAEMAALYRVSAIFVCRREKNTAPVWHQMIRYDDVHFVQLVAPGARNPIVELLDTWRFQLELLKPLVRPGDGPEAFVDYTEQCDQLEQDCMILSVKPDIHFNCVPADMLYQSIMEGFEQAGIASGPELLTLLEQLQRIHESRYSNVFRKHRPTHLVYSLPAMERFMRTGVQADQFFIQRAYTPEERRRLIRELYEQMQENPFFHVHFLREGLPEMRNEVTFYEGKGVLLLDAFTGYDLHDDHSEALITLPAFMESFRTFFMDELLQRLVMTRAETQAALERLMAM